MLARELLIEPLLVIESPLLGTCNTGLWDVAMDFGWKKILLIVVGVFGLPVIFILLLSNPMMDTYYRWAKEDPKNEMSDWVDHQWLLMKTADTCYKTLRVEKSAFFYYEYLRLYPEDLKNRPHALLHYGHALNESNKNKDAITVYRLFIIEYPDRPKDCEAAQAGITHIKYNKP